MDFAPSAFWNSRSITHLANYPSRSLPMISSDESFLYAASLFVSSAGSPSHPAPVHVVRASADSLASYAATARCGPGDTELQRHAGSVPQYAPWSTDCFGNHGQAVLAEANLPSVFVVLGPASEDGRESSVPAKPWLPHAGGDHASASPSWHCTRCDAPPR